MLPNQQLHNVLSLLLAFHWSLWAGNVVQIPTGMVL